MQIKEISLIDGILRITVLPMPYFEQGINWIESLCNQTGLTLKSTDYGADLIQAQVFFEQTDYILSLNFMTEDAWIKAISNAQQAHLERLYTHLRVHFTTN
jgi:hypothetical protein